MLIENKKKILFLCTGNSCRSQMAEGFCRNLYGDKYEIYSAGIEKHGMNLRAVRVMQECGIDISSHKSKTIQELGSLEFDFVFTVCGHANELCPIFRGDAIVTHVGFDDPPKLAQGLTSEEEILKHYRIVRDQINQWIQKLM